MDKKVEEKENVIVDVRTVAEFRSGHAPGSVNIPLQEIPQHIARLKGYNSPLVLCCATGNRSGIAQQYLSGLGIACENAGAWQDAEYFISRNNNQHV